jgi:hypothetical protein
MSSPSAEGTGSFTIATDREARLIRYKLEGLWDLDTFEKYRVAMTAEMEWFRGAGLSFNLLGDLRNFTTQTQDLNDRRQEMILKAETLGLDKCAIVVSSSIVRMQVGRLSNNSYAFFTSEDEAKEWLGIA